MGLGFGLGLGLGANLLESCLAGPGYMAARVAECMCVGVHAQGERTGRVSACA